MIKFSKLNNSNLTFGISHFLFSSIKLSSNKLYPYQFGGVKNANFKQSQPSYQTLKQIFQEQTIQGFKQAYRFLLHSLAHKNVKSLQNICQPNLIKNINFKNVQLINHDAKIQTVVAGSIKAFGAKFVREATDQLRLMYSENSDKFYINLGLMNPSAISPGDLMKYMSSGLPILMGFEVLFKSSIKLVSEQCKKPSNTQQVHSVQFQVQGNVNMAKYMKMAMSMSGQKSKIDIEQSKKILKQMVGNDYQWKIGDIDRVLNGNMKIVN